MLILLQATIPGLLRLAEAEFFCARLDALRLLARAPAGLLGARAAPFTAARYGLQRGPVTDCRARLFPRGGLDVCTAGLVRAWRLGLPAILGDQNGLFPRDA
jgi:hypothetical protein